MEDLCPRSHAELCLGMLSIFSKVFLSMPCFMNLIFVCSCMSSSRIFLDSNECPDLIDRPGRAPDWPVVLLFVMACYVIHNSGQLFTRFGAAAISNKYGWKWSRSQSLVRSFLISTSFPISISSFPVPPFLPTCAGGGPQQRFLEQCETYLVNSRSFMLKQLGW